MARAILVHGWGGSPQRDFFPWLTDELKKKGYEVVVPEMPDTENPKMESWIPKLAEVVGSLREEDILIGHSIGCQTIIRFLATLDKGKADKVILVAPWGSALSNLSGNEEEEIAKPWKETPIDFEKAKIRANSFVAILSDNDPYVPLKENSELFKNQLGAEIIVEHNKGHFNPDDGVTELPILMGYI